MTEIQAVVVSIVIIAIGGFIGGRVKNRFWANMLCVTSFSMAIAIATVLKDWFNDPGIQGHILDAISVFFVYWCLIDLSLFAMYLGIATEK